jgi:3-phenylpropionate/cinnamic acid dioxygenase small subunit
MLEAIDIIRIHQLLGRYGHAIDALDWDAFAELFVPDAVLDYTAVRAPEVCHGIDEILEYFHGANHPSAHHATNIVVDESGDASGEVHVHSKFLAPFTRDSHDPKRLFGGDYHDIVVRVDGTWKFASKVCTGRWLLTQGSNQHVAEHRRTF